VTKTLILSFVVHDDIPVRTEMSARDTLSVTQGNTPTTLAVGRSESRKMCTVGVVGVNYDTVILVP
jgi:hypothetical protein